jgi:predicted alpha/beta-fold hydrolase
MSGSLLFLCIVDTNCMTAYSQGNALFQFQHTHTENTSERATIIVAWQTNKPSYQHMMCHLPPTFLQMRAAALLGAYWHWPVLLILCVAQGSGKSTYYKWLVQDVKNSQWIDCL